MSSSAPEIISQTYCNTLKAPNIMNCDNAHSRNAALSCLIQRVSSCLTCPRMEGRTRVFGASNGSLESRILFIAEAPGRLGADISGRPLSGDQTGRNFQQLLEISGLQREELFLTNAVLCNPRDKAGRNSTPTRKEILNCSAHLRETLEIVQPLYVVSLGRIALQALNIIEAHSVTLKADVGKCIEWYGRWLMPLYHPGTRSRINRSTARQQEDFQNLSQLTCRRKTV